MLTPSLFDKRFMAGKGVISALLRLIPAGLDHRPTRNGVQLRLSIHVKGRTHERAKRKIYRMGQLEFLSWAGEDDYRDSDRS